MARKIEVELVGDSRSLERAFSRGQGAGSKLGKTIGTGLKVAAGVGAAGLAGLAVVAKVGFDEFNQGQKVAAQTNAVLKSTGRVANVTAKQVDDLAVSLMKKSGVDDEVIKSGENVLLTFTNIRNEAGKGNKIFTEATKAILDMSVALGTDLQSSTIQVGKALNDPIKGITALTRVGVTFSDAQKTLIKRLVESGDKMGAQKVILKELRKEFGGSAEAAGKTFAGQINVLKESFNNWAGDMVAKVMPALTDAFGQIGDFFAKFGRAKGFTAKLRITWLGVSGVVNDLTEKIQAALFGGRHVLKLPSGKIMEITQTQGLVDQIREGMRNADWAEIGRTIGENISSKVRITADFIENILTVASQFIDSHMDRFAALGAKMLLSIISKLLDPAFWKDNWKLILGIAIATFPITKVASIGAKFGMVFLRPLERLIPSGVGRIIARAVDNLATQFMRFPPIVQEVFRRAATIIRAAVGRVIEWVKGRFGQLPGWMQKALRLGIWGTWATGVIHWVNIVIGWVKDLIGWISRIHMPSLPSVGGGVPFVPGIASGGDIARSGMAIVHRGERVLPARVVNRGGAGAAGGGQVQVIVVGGDQQAIQWLRNAVASWERTNGKAAFG